MKDSLEKHLQQSFKIKGGMYEVNFLTYRYLCYIITLFANHYTKIIVVRVSVRAYGREFTGSESTPAQKALFLCKAEVWRCNSWLTDTASNGTNSRVNRGF